MVSAISAVLPVIVLVSNVALVVAFVALLSRKSFGSGISRWLGRHAIALGLVISIVAVAGSLFYSNVVGFEPCDLCWWQRIFIYPQLVLFLTALKTKDRRVFKYSWRLAVIAVLISLYHEYVQMGGNPLIPCSLSASCAKLYVSAYGYVTIPLMALTVSLSLILLAWANKRHE